MNAVDYLKRYWWYYAALFLILLFALYYRAGVPGQPGAISSFVIPTWGNTMYHVGIERVTRETGHYPSQEISYGGGFPNFYVPGYRMLVVALSTATGIDPMPMSGIVVLLLGAFCLLAVYIVAYRLSGGNYYVALFAAFFFLLSPDLTINTERPFPELMGLFILPMALYFVFRQDWPLAIVASVVMALTHQQSELALMVILLCYLLAQIAYLAWRWYREEKVQRASIAELAWIVALMLALGGTYAVWQMYTMGTLDITKISQLTYHEQWPVTLATLLETGAFVLVFLALGLAYVFVLPAWRMIRGMPPAAKAVRRPAGKPLKSYWLSIPLDARLLLLAWMVGSLILTKNEWIPFLNTLESRFYTYFVDAAIILAGFGMYWLLAAIDFTPMLERPGPAPEEAGSPPAT